MVRMMMALHDFDTAYHGNQTFGAAKKTKRLGNWRTTAGRYFLWVQISHLNEALRCLRAYANFAEIRKGEACGCTMSANSVEPW